MSPGSNRSARAMVSAASIAGCAHQHEPCALKPCSSTSHSMPRVDHHGLASTDSIVSAGAPVKPASANIPALTPAMAPQPDPSLTIVG